MAIDLTPKRSAPWWSLFDCCKPPPSSESPLNDDEDGGAWSTDRAAAVAIAKVEDEHTVEAVATSPEKKPEEEFIDTSSSMSETSSSLGEDVDDAASDEEGNDDEIPDMSAGQRSSATSHAEDLSSQTEKMNLIHFLVLVVLWYMFGKWLPKSMSKNLETKMSRSKGVECEDGENEDGHSTALKSSGGNGKCDG